MCEHPQGDHEGGGERAAIFGRDGEGAMRAGASASRTRRAGMLAAMFCAIGMRREASDPRGAVRAQSMRARARARARARGGVHAKVLAPAGATLGPPVA